MSFHSSSGLYNHWWPVFQASKDHCVHIRLPKPDEKLAAPEIDFYVVISETFFPKGNMGFVEYKAIVSHNGNISLIPHTTMRDRDRGNERFAVASPAIDRLEREDGVRVTPRTRLSSKNPVIYMHTERDAVIDTLNQAYEKMKLHQKPEFNRNGFEPRTFEKGIAAAEEPVNYNEMLLVARPLIAGKKASEIYIDPHANPISENASKTEVPDRLYTFSPNTKNKIIETPCLKIKLDHRMVSKSKKLTPKQKATLTKMLSGRFEAWIMPKAQEPFTPHFFIIKRNKKDSIHSATRFLVQFDKEGKVEAAPYFYASQTGKRVITHPSHNMLFNHDESVLDNATLLANFLAPDMNFYWRTYYDARDMSDDELKQEYGNKRPDARRLTVMQYIQQDRATAASPLPTITKPEYPRERIKPAAAKSV